MYGSSKHPRVLQGPPEDVLIYERAKGRDDSPGVRDHLSTANSFDVKGGVKCQKKGPSPPKSPQQEYVLGPFPKKPPFWEGTVAEEERLENLTFVKRPHEISGGERNDAKAPIGQSFLKVDPPLTKKSANLSNIDERSGNAGEKMRTRQKEWPGGGIRDHGKKQGEGIGEKKKQSSLETPLERGDGVPLSKNKSHRRKPPGHASEKH